MHPNYRKEAALKLAQEIKEQGFRVFISKTGTYGFFTDMLGTRVVSFQFDLGGFRYHGNYKSDQPRTTGTGWELAIENFAGMFNQYPPSWATRGAKWEFTTLEQYLKTYQSSSQFTEIH